MTLNNEQLIAGDHRRAAALIAHDFNHSMAGVESVMLEASEADRVGPLILALLNIFGGIIDPIRGPWFDERLASFLHKMAAKENT